MATYHQIIDAMPNAVILLDSHGVVDYCNDNATSLLEHPLKSYLWRELVSELFAPKADDWHEVSLRNGRRVRLDTSVVNEKPGQLIVLTDLTETRRLQNRISHLQRLSSMGKMVASLAHQIRTPLSAAILYAQNLKQGTISTVKQQRFSGKLLSRLHSLEQQVNDMLLFAKSGEQPMLEELNTNTLIQQVMMNTESYAEQHQVKINCIDESVGVVLRANQTALVGAIQNLLNNAVDASQPGQEVLVKTDIDDVSWRVSVIDAGAGIPPEKQDNVFTPFFTEKSNGTGLGLAVVQTVIKAHNGHIDWESQLGKGSRFTLSLPVHEWSESLLREVRYG
ncbi:sensor histidine kinase [Idiomarina ramblicola]|uniref:histidine kinase n=1 Tax=Idiomarina ramblicola TaxID=263724 RepID=A0A432Z158_9GAMM|nr:ATP-binding protein [Idiomarina ramblicola]RUO71624.1 PAS domain-containing sensor histidine kinase [Idiomarina ramblicola]